MPKTIAHQKGVKKHTTEIFCLEKKTADCLEIPDPISITFKSLKKTNLFNFPWIALALASID